MISQLNASVGLPQSKQGSLDPRAARDMCKAIRGGIPQLHVVLALNVVAH
jgi:hypothetical protein